MSVGKSTNLFDIIALCLLSLAVVFIAWYFLYWLICDSKKPERKKFYFERLYLKNLEGVDHGAQVRTMAKRLITRIKSHMLEIEEAINLGRYETIYYCPLVHNNLTPKDDVLHKAYVFYHQSIEKIIGCFPASDLDTPPIEVSPSSWSEWDTNRIEGGRKLHEGYLLKLDEPSQFFESGFDLAEWKVLLALPITSYEEQVP